MTLRLRSRRGIVEPMAMIVCFPVLLIVVAFMLYYGRALYAKAAVEDAATVGARWAVTSLSGAQGCRQAREAMQVVFDGYYVDAGGFSHGVSPVVVWGRGLNARVSVRYRVNQAPVPIFGALPGNLQVSTSYDVPIDKFNNRYEWATC